MNEKPAIINISYCVNPVLNVDDVKNWDYSSCVYGDDEGRKKAMDRNIDDVARRDELIRLCYSSDYHIDKDEYIVQGEQTFHHLIARRVEKMPSLPVGRDITAEEWQKWLDADEKRLGISIEETSPPPPRQNPGWSGQ